MLKAATSWSESQAENCVLSLLASQLSLSYLPLLRSESLVPPSFPSSNSLADLALLAFLIFFSALAILSSLLYAFTQHEAIQQIIPRRKKTPAV